MQALNRGPENTVSVSSSHQVSAHSAASERRQRRQGGWFLSAPRPPGTSATAAAAARNCEQSRKGQLTKIRPSRQGPGTAHAPSKLKSKDQHGVGDWQLRGGGLS